jgi:precorrin-6A/cobalt-precorrin-6A reductase
MPGAGESPHLLILGGTEEGYALAQALAGRPDCRVTSSLAGATRTPRLPAGVHRVGGFGGLDGLRDWLVAERVAVVVDASHPFATRITAQATQAAAAAGCRYLRLERPPWQPRQGDRWTQVPNLAASLASLRQLGARRVLAALGARALPELASQPLGFVLRGIVPPAALPANVAWLAARGPFTVAAERRLLQAQAVDALLCRNSGGEGARAKLDAARELGLPVVLIERRGTVADAFTDVAGALSAIDRLLSG